ncbi:hypothetical protein [Botrimarina colliarenosi]|uniref:hypothetical protein n=1 Tax=Botrimarina colliarenosi TaxID=2528001 RepID=UPI001E362A03|nr:hypothetical protein [Botrimarina colliarenosi]
MLCPAAFLVAEAYGAKPITIAEGPVSLGASGVAINIEHGEPNKVLDGVGWMIGVPSKLMLLDSRADNHQISPETVEEACDFLASHEVDGVMVRVNQYDPLGEWKRLAQNDRVGLGWRATVGAVYTLGYSVLPGRLFGGDWYNPFTDTVNIYSDVPALAMEQAAQAHDVHQKSHPGFYSAVRLLPFIGIVHEARAKQAVFNFVDKNGTTDEQAEARRVLAPQMGRELGGQAAIFIPQVDAIMSVGGAAVGHVVGRYQAHQIETDAYEREREEVPPVYGPQLIQPRD